MGKRFSPGSGTSAKRATGSDGGRLPGEKEKGKRQVCSVEKKTGIARCCRYLSLPTTSGIWHADIEAVVRACNRCVSRGNRHCVLDSCKSSIYIGVCRLQIPVGCHMNMVMPSWL